MQPSVPISFEFFPPKTVEGTNYLSKTAYQLTDCYPVFFSVTCGAGGSNRDNTMNTIKLLQHNTSIPIAAHISCIESSCDDILNTLNTYRSMGVKRLIALRGDLAPDSKHTGQLQFANELVAFVRKTTGHYFHIEVAAYPECHPLAHNTYDDIVNLKKKYDAGANSAITQFFFNCDAYFYFLDDCIKQGINMPITPGIMPITRLNQLTRFSAMCGAEIPKWIVKRLEAYENDDYSIQAFGVEVVHHLCEQLITGGAPGLHFYTLNRSDTCLTLWQLLAGTHQSSLYLMDKKHTAMVSN
jgi:methylenetetrahydrofolate reductase (NADPH)